MGTLRDEIDAAFREPGAAGATLLFTCRHGASTGPQPRPGVIAFELQCAGMLPPSFIEYGLRAGANGVMVAACPQGDCEYRFGVAWTEQRVAGEREPRLRRAVDRARVALLSVGREDSAALVSGLDAFRARLAAPAAESGAGKPRRPVVREIGNG